MRDVVEAREEAEIAPQRHALVQRRLVGDEAASSAHSVCILAYRDAIDEDVAFARREDPTDDPARGCLSGTVGAEERHDLARVDLEGHVVERQRPLEPAR